MFCKNGASSMKIGLAQINTTTGDFESNYKKILEFAQILKTKGADFAVFPELALCGALPKDKSASPNFLRQNELYLEKLAGNLPLPALVGLVRKSGGAAGAYNSLAWINPGSEVKFCDKCLLPNYGIFDEPRNFDASCGACTVEFKGRKIGLSICEDIWTLDSKTAPRYANKTAPLELLAGKKIDLLVNVSASLWSPENERARLELLPKVARFVKAPLAFCNLVGGNDEAVCAGASGVWDSSGRPICFLGKFKEAAEVADLENSKPCALPEFDRIAEMCEALKMSLRDFVTKSGFKKVMLGLSGGIDSALVAALAAEALGPENVLGFALPSKYSSDHSVRDAEDLAKNLGIFYKKISIAEVVEAAEKSLANLFAGKNRDLTEENIQSRTRGLLLMAISNKFGAMLLATGNKSECAVGYCTLYGDTCGGFAPISDVYKTDVYKLSLHINREREIIPLNTIQKPPSAELRPGQKDSDSLPEYEVLDGILRNYIEGGKSVSEIEKMGFDGAVLREVVRKFERSEYKRRQLPPGPRLTSLSFGSGRRVALSDRRDYEFQGTF